jgi:hypothetical protein
MAIDSYLIVEDPGYQTTSDGSAYVGPTALDGGLVVDGGTVAVFSGGTVSGLDIGGGIDASGESPAEVLRGDAYVQSDSNSTIDVLDAPGGIATDYYAQIGPSPDGSPLGAVQSVEDGGIAYSATVYYRGAQFILGGVASGTTIRWCPVRRWGRRI